MSCENPTGFVRKKAGFPIPPKSELKLGNGSTIPGISISRSMPGVTGVTIHVAVCASSSRGLRSSEIGSGSSIVTTIHLADSDGIELLDSDGEVLVENI